MPTDGNPFRNIDLEEERQWGGGQSVRRVSRLPRVAHRGGRDSHFCHPRDVVRHVGRRKGTRDSRAIPPRALRHAEHRTTPRHGVQRELAQTLKEARDTRPCVCQRRHIRRSARKQTRAARALRRSHARAYKEDGAKRRVHRRRRRRADHAEAPAGRVRRARKRSVIATGSVFKKTFCLCLRNGRGDSPSRLLTHGGGGETGAPL